MPQLDFSNPLVIAQLVWLLIIFGALYYIMAVYALPRVESVLEDRRRRIEGDLEAAQAMKATADAAIAEYRAAAMKARTESQAAIATALAAAQADTQARADALAARLAAQIDAADKRIAAARESALGALRDVAVETAGALVTKLTGQTQPALVVAAVDRALAPPLAPASAR
jgi:F-type H+-transporting ATPase subunit b